MCSDHRWNLPSADLHYKETFEHAALRILDRQVGMHARPATAVMLHTTQTVPTDVLPNEGQHTITVFMGLWIKDPIDDLTVRLISKSSIADTLTFSRRLSMKNSC